jgi:tetratricopeptide (TPR) repeat protein
MAFDQRAAWGHMMDAAGVLWDHGSEFGENQALHDAIAAYRMVLDLAYRERVPLDWAMAQNNLGTALRTLGQRESGTVRLEEAVAAYNEALEIFSASYSDYYETICYSNRERALALIKDRRK